ncbi:hypothetical protein JCM16138_23100 [Thermococcus atlanticus]
MKEEHVIGLILILSLVVSLAAKTYLGIAIAAIGIPLYLAYVSREQNIMASSRLFDKDLFMMIGIMIIIILVFSLFSDPRVGIILLAVLIPVIFYVMDHLKTGKK